MTLNERIQAARKKFYEEFERGADEWSEMLEHGCCFAAGLLDCDDSHLLAEQVVKWLEASAEMKRED